MKCNPAQTSVRPCQRLCTLFTLLTALLLFSAGSAVAMGLDFGTDPTASFVSSAQVVSESSGAASVTVQLSDTSSADVTIPFTVSGTAAGSGVDYTIAASPLIIPAGGLTAEIAVLLTADTVSEADETVVVTLEPPTNAVLGGSTVHTLTITEGDVPSVDPDSAVLPVYQRMSFISKTFPSPVDVAADAAGRMYVADSYAGTVFRFSPGGFFIDSLAGLASPLCIAVDAGGRMYVGSQESGSVAVYDRDFNLVFKLGSGDGEFGHPGDIAVDSTGTVYVVDTKNNRVSLWDANGNFIDLLGEPGDGNGQFNRPLSVAIDEIDQKIIVLDRSNGARVQFFDMATRTFQSSWYKYSTAIGGLIRPQQIAVDALHRLYISESAQNIVLVYDTAGAYLGAVYDTESPVRSPVGIAVSPANRLYVASRASKKVEVYGLDEFAAMAVSPAALSFTATVGTPGPPPKDVTIRNAGTASFTVAAEGDVDWLNAAGADYVLSPESTGAVEVTVDATGLDPGEYSGTLSVSAGPNMAESVQVMLTVLPEPPYIPAARLSVTPQTMSFTCEVGSLPDPQAVTIANTGDMPLLWEISPEKDWMSVSSTIGTVAAGEAAQNVVLLPDTASLTAGTYTGYVEVYAYGAYDNTAIIDVSLTLTTPAPGPSPTPGPGTSWKGNFNRTWTVAAQTNGTALNGIWGSSDTDIFAVGDSGTILHYNGLDWDEEILPTTLNINGVWGTSASNVYAVGESGLLLHYNGTRWTDADATFSGTLQGVWCGNDSSCITSGQDITLLAGTTADAPWQLVYSREHFGSLRGIWGVSESDIYAVGDFGTLLHYNGMQWTVVDLGTSEGLYDVWGSGSGDVYVVGRSGSIFHYDGDSWASMPSETVNTLAGVWGNSADEVYAVGEDGTILLKTGTAWNILQTGLTEDFNDAWAAVEDEIYVVGSEGSILFGRSSFAWGLFYPAILPYGRQVPGVNQENR